MLKKLCTYTLENDFLYLCDMMRHKERSTEELLPYLSITNVRPSYAHYNIQLRTWQILLQYWKGRCKLLK